MSHRQASQGMAAAEGAEGRGCGAASLVLAAAPEAAAVGVRPARNP